MIIGIWDGCSEGDIADLSMSPHRPGNGKPYATVEIDDTTWADWRDFLKEQAKWLAFWSSHLVEPANRYRSR